MSLIEREYQSRVAAMSVAEKMAHAAALLQWTREMIARDIQARNPGISAERLRWEVALRQYGAEPQARALIEGILARVPD